ncbi:DUF6602 domain-containing protein [Archangium lansingense]|uniref:DUF6602 domain-containing protein n=1 Tax=Archangium lansingense TaxID=2995310 RepID=UPI003B80DDB5
MSQERKKRRTKKEIPGLPNTKNWGPRKDASRTLAAAFLKRCLSAERLIKIRAQEERSMNLDNYDSGLGVEDIIREQLREILPRRYGVYSGVLNDHRGYTAGDVDIVIFNDTWFPVIKPPATSHSRRAHFPIEGAYAVCEVKQTVDFNVLDQAMEKLVSCHRLVRPATFANRLVENRDEDECFHGLTNPLYSAIIATDLRKGVRIDELVERFFYINKSLKRLEVVRALCVLGHGTVTWAFVDDSEEFRPALFMREDVFRPIYPAYSRCETKRSSALYHLVFDLSLHLYHSVLGAEDIVVSYGEFADPIKGPSKVEISLSPDSEWADKLDQSYDGCGRVGPRDAGGGPPLSELHAEFIMGLNERFFSKKGS